ncbi:hypothetical protein ACRRTK_003205 [Alexandromys fortis]
MLRSSTMNKNPASPAVNIKPNSSGNPCETVHDRPSKLVFLDLPQLGSPPVTPISPAPERQTQPPTAMGLSAKRATHLPARLPERRSQLRRRGRGVTGVHGGHPSSTEPPPRPLRSAAGRRRPRANFAGEEETPRLTERTDREAERTVHVSARRRGRLTFPPPSPRLPSPEVCTGTPPRLPGGRYRTRPALRRREALRERRGESNRWAGRYGQETRSAPNRIGSIACGARP